MKRLFLLLCCLLFLNAKVFPASLRRAEEGVTRFIADSSAYAARFVHPDTIADISSTSRCADFRTKDLCAFVAYLREHHLFLLLYSRGKTYALGDTYLPVPSSPGKDTGWFSRGGIHYFYLALPERLGIRAGLYFLVSHSSLPHCTSFYPWIRPFLPYLLPRSEKRDDAVITHQGHVLYRFSQTSAKSRQLASVGTVALFALLLLSAVYSALRADSRWMLLSALMLAFAQVLLLQLPAVTTAWAAVAIVPVVLLTYQRHKRLENKRRLWFGLFYFALCLFLLFNPLSRKMMAFLLILYLLLGLQCLLKRLKYRITISAVCLLLAALSIVFFQFRAYKQYVSLKLKTLSAETRDLSRVIAQEMLSTLDAQSLYADMMTSPAGSSPAFTLYRRSIAAQMNKDMSIYLYDSKGIVIDHYNHKRSFAFLNINKLIDHTTRDGSLSLYYRDQAGADIWVQGAALQVEERHVGGILVMVPVDYYDQALETRNPRLKETFFLHSGPSPLRRHRLYYLVVKEGNIIHSNADRPLVLPDSITALSRQNAAYHAFRDIRLDNSRVPAFLYKDPGRPLLLVILQDTTLLNHVYRVLFFLLLGMVGYALIRLTDNLVPLLANIITPSLRLKFALLIIGVAVVPNLLFYQVLRFTFNQYFAGYSLEQGNIRHSRVIGEISRIIHTRALQIMRSRLMADFISQPANIERMERHLFGFFQDTPIAETRIRHQDHIIYEATEGLLSAQAPIQPQSQPFVVSKNRVFMVCDARDKALDALFLFELTPAFLAKLADQYACDLGIYNATGFISISSFQALLQAGLVPLNAESFPLAHQSQVTVRAHPFLWTSLPVPAPRLFTVSRQFRPDIMLRLHRLSFIVSLLFLLIILLIIRTADHSLARQFDLFIARINQVKSHAIDTIPAADMAHKEFKEVARVVNALVAALQRNSLITDSLLQNMPIGLLLLDNTGRMQRKNKTMHDYEAWLGSDLARYMEEPADAPRQISRAQGEQVRIFNLAKIPITMKDNTIATLFIVMDISQTVAYERVKLASKMAEKVAHDIKNPLMPIKLYMQHLVKLQASDSAKFSVRFPETSRRILQQIAVIEGILKRYIAQRTALANRESYVTTQALFDKLQDSLAFLPEGIALRISLHAADATATIDETEFIATVHNLVKNALEAMGQQGEISITQHKAGACMQVTVSDTGSGMSEDTLNRLQQKGGSSKDLGFGIGLTLVKDFVERYHGRMDIQSRPGQGTAVTLTLKVYTP